MAAAEPSDGGRGAQQVAQHVDRGTFQVEVARVAALQDPQGDEVNQQAEHGDRQHRPGDHLDRREEAAHGLDQDPADHGDQGCTAPIVGAPGDPEGHPGKRQGGGVGQHMTGVGDQGQGAG
jgi:hypothetical protein